jgi:hypothetical protein
MPARNSEQSDRIISEDYMMHRWALCTVLASFGFLGLLSPASHAATINQTYAGSLPATITGTLPDQGSVLELKFTLDALSNLDISTSSYEEGEGFQPNLFLYDMVGEFVTAGVPFGQVNPITGIIGDSRLQAMNLPAGMYTLAVTDFLLNQSITATNLSAGFTENYGSGSDFVDAMGNTRIGAYDLTIQASPVPEPSSLLLAAPVLAFFALRRRNSAAKILK